MGDRSHRRAWIAAAAVLLAGAALRLHGVASQPLLGDEDWVAATALHYVESGQLGPTMWHHPNLRNLVVWAAGDAFGYGPVALRATSLVLGILTIPLVGLLLFLLTEDRPAALVASFLVAFEQVHVTFSRQAIQETWTAFLFLAGTAAAVVAWRRRRPGWLLPAGIAFGLGVGSKFHALFPLAVCGVAGLRLAWKERSPAVAAWVVASLALLPALIYLATYAPWFARGYGMADWFEMQRVVLAKMATHRGNPMDQTFDVAAWQWFLRPMGYANFVLAAGQPRVTIAFSNPLVWLAVLPSAWLVGREAFREPGWPGAHFVLLLFGASYLPLALSPRPIWLLSSLATLPFAFMLVGLAASWIARERPRAVGVLALWAALVVVGSLALYPLAVGRGAPEGYLAPIVERFRPAADHAVNR